MGWSRVYTGQGEQVLTSLLLSGPLIHPSPQPMAHAQPSVPPFTHHPIPQRAPLPWLIPPSTRPTTTGEANRLLFGRQEKRRPCGRIRPQGAGAVEGHLGPLRWWFAGF